MKRFIPLVALTLLMSASSALATVPSTISYQGVLTDGGGNLVPDGAYNLTFKIYDVQVLGVALWTETQVGVTVTKGGFAVLLGAVTPLTGLAFDKPYWLGIAVGANPEMTPRVAMASSPYGLSLRLPFAGTASSAGPALSIQNTGGGPAMVADPHLEVGTPASDGFQRVYADAQPGLEIGPWGSGYGSFLHWLNPDGSYTGGYEPDSNGDRSGYFWVGGANGAFTVDGNGGATNDPIIYMSGTGSFNFIDTNQSGDASVALTGNAVSAGEILDEPGISQGRVGSAFLNNATFVDAASTTIAIPAPGYIVLEGDGQVNHYGTTLANYSHVQITDVTPGVEDYSHYGYAGSGAYPNTSDNFQLVHQQRVYYMAAAGAYTFYFQLKQAQANGSAYIWQPSLRATYYPTSYGTVTAIANGVEAGQFSSARPIASDETVGQPSAAGATMVDLRELELRVARERADLERAQRQLAEARLAEQAQRRVAAKKGGN